MKASYGRQNFLFNGAEKPGLENNIKITLPMSTSTICLLNLWLEVRVFVFELQVIFFSCFASFSSLDKAHFFSAFYKNLDKLIQNNISEIHTR